MISFTIYRLGDDAPVRLAAKDLARCLRAMTGAPMRVRWARTFREDRPGIYVGLGFTGINAPKADRWDDALLIKSVGDSLVLTGSNGRSVLFAAYRWLEALGARWVRPGKDGEYLPKIEAPKLTGWNIREKAANRHRGICIEGTCYLKQVLDLIDWMPKLRMNAYMLQFRVSAYFWRRWYERDVPGVNDEPRLLTLEECAALDGRVARAVKERGLLYHKVGHGWTCEAVGNHGSGWEQEGPAPEEIRHLLAEVNGKRDWWGGVPLNTELCYSNPEARRRFVDEVIHYAQAHPEVDVLHIWASDGMNNHCECANCAPLQPSDWYITLLNEVSPKLKAIAPNMRIVALCYSNTMWPPYQVPPSGIGDNLIFMFAPISRCYAHSILDRRCSAEPPLQPWPRNKVGVPRANSDYRDMLKAWQAYLPAGTDAFVFDYHFWVHFPDDLLTSDFARMLYHDVREYHRAGGERHGALPVAAHLHAHRAGAGRRRGIPVVGPGDAAGGGGPVFRRCLRAGERGGARFPERFSQTGGHRHEPRSLVEWPHAAADAGHRAPAARLAAGAAGGKAGQHAPGTQAVVEAAGPLGALHGAGMGRHRRPHPRPSRRRRKNGESRRLPAAHRAAGLFLAGRSLLAARPQRHPEAVAGGG